jgi:hypothetical protein
MPPAFHRIEIGEDLLVDKVAGGTEEDEGVGVKHAHEMLLFRGFLRMANEPEVALPVANMAKLGSRCCNTYFSRPTKTMVLGDEGFMEVQILGKSGRLRTSM